MRGPGTERLLSAAPAVPLQPRLDDVAEALRTEAEPVSLRDVPMLLDDEEPSLLPLVGAWRMSEVVIRLKELYCEPL